MRLLVGWLLVLLSASCSPKAPEAELNRAENLSADSWLRAQTMLASKAWRQLSELEVNELVTTSHLPTIAKRKPYLIRGVLFNELTGDFEVFENNGRVLVHHESLGKGPRPMRRKAVIALLQTEPADVYVSCSMAE